LCLLVRTARMYAGVQKREAIDSAGRTPDNLQRDTSAHRMASQRKARRSHSQRGFGHCTERIEAAELGNDDFGELSKRLRLMPPGELDRKSTRLNSSHDQISY